MVLGGEGPVARAARCCEPGQCRGQSWSDTFEKMKMGKKWQLSLWYLMLQDYGQTTARWAIGGSDTVRVNPVTLQCRGSKTWPST